ncbi:MAG: flagellar basal-body MS-ring/collar protein FliF [Alphaproteobacteria bacterium]|nr:flagellar basal-body MS-ring/collar protein FliF [Alphaproteobacteria bacterium]
MHLIRSLGTARVAALGLSAALLLGFFVFLMARFTSPEMALLYGELDPDDTSQIVSKLEALGVPHKIAGDGTQVYVASDRVLRLRMSMAEEGLPSGGSVGYEIFDRSEGIGSSSFVQNVNRLRALEGELARSIRTVAQVKAARVHLVLPRRQLFSRTHHEPTASIALQLKGGSQLSGEQVSAIQYLVAAAVPGLNPQNVSIVDSRGKLLARGGEGEDSAQLAATSAQETRQAYEHRVARKIEELLERSLGPGTVRAQVAAELDFDRITTTEETYDPDSQVVRSTQSVEERSDSKDGEKGPTPVTVAEELPEPETTQEGPEKVSTESNARTEETVNYEISRVVKNHVRESGLVKRISVAVLVDGVYGPPGEDEIRPYEPRSEEDMQRITALVRSAMGYDETRGDTVEVVNMQFAQAEALEDEAYHPLLDFDKNDIFRIGEVLILLITAVLIILFVVRPVMQRLLDQLPKPGGEADGPAQLTDGSGGVGALPDGTDPEDASMIDIAAIEGKVKQSSIRKVGEIVQNHPEESVAILRNWMFNEG